MADILMRGEAPDFITMRHSSTETIAASPEAVTEHAVMLDAGTLPMEQEVSRGTEVMPGPTEAMLVGHQPACAQALPAGAAPQQRVDTLPAEILAPGPRHTVAADTATDDSYAV